MAFKVFTQIHVYGTHLASNEKDKSIIHCLECYERNIYIGTKNATIQHFIFPHNINGDPSPGQCNIREGRTRKLSSSHQIAKLRAVPLFNHLLVLMNRSVTALNMFSLEPIPALKNIQHVSLFEVCDSFLIAQTAFVQMVTSSSRRKAIQIHLVGVDRWEVVKEIPLLQEPVALAVEGTSMCLATIDRYLLCDIQTGSSEEIFRHNHSRRHVIVTSGGHGEFLLNGPESLGVFVMTTGACQRPPLQWPQKVLAAVVCFPYIISLQPQVISVYSMVDQQHKQTVSLTGARGLVSTPDGVLVFTERDIFSLHLVPFQEQIQALVRDEKVEEALLLLDGVQAHRPLDSYKELQKAISCLAGFAKFYQGGFSEARDLFIKGELDPREIIQLYPDMQSLLREDFHPQFDQVNKRGGLQVLWEEDGDTFHRYLHFLRDFLRAVKGTQQGLDCIKEVDCALLRLYVELGDTEKLHRLVASPNECELRHCVPVLERHSRFFALGSLFQSHGDQIAAIQTWMKIADGIHQDLSCPDIYGHIVWTLSQMQAKDAVWRFADWALQRNQKTGVQIFIRRHPDDHVETQDALEFLEKYPLALLLYLEFLTHELSSEEVAHHNRLALAYVALMQQEEEEILIRKTREKLQQQLWESKFYVLSTVYECVKSTTLHTEKAILLCRLGKYSEALQVLVQERDPQAAVAFCNRATQGRDSQFRQTLWLTLLQTYLSSEELISDAVDLLNNNPRVFAAEKVIQLLPNSWSVQLTSQFLIASFRETLHQRRMAMLQKALSQAELMRHKHIRTHASKTKFSLTKGQKCKVCQTELTEPQFARSLHGDLMHIRCIGLSTS